ncbi:MAG: sulfur carrier protein ThiS [Hyphomicrobium sp.]|uniref:sulfur carrier protein ThiS n=1 Tax=Hyphomicrobium sp. TaxID=82 RepID=UPI003D13C5D2
MTTTATRLSTITLNGARLETGAATLADLVVEQGLADSKVATALNGEFVAAGRRAGTRLSHGDRIEIVSARQGG